MEEEGKAKGEEAFRNTRVPPWTKQITVRSVVTSFVLSVVFNFIVCKLNFTTGIIPSLNVAAGLLGFALIKSYTTLLSNCGLLGEPFTRGMGSYLLGMSPYIGAQLNGGNTPINTKGLSLGWMFAFLFVVSFVGLFSIVPLRKLMILKYKLTYPSGTATALLVNSLHTPKGAKLAKKQVVVLFKSFSGSFVFGFFQWFFTAGDDCGFSSFPTFGLKAYSKMFYFDFSPTYVGVGMICPYVINASLLLGAVISWGILWPWIEHKKGIWYSADLPTSSLNGVQGYRSYLPIHSEKESSSANHEDADQNTSDDLDSQLRTEYFSKDQIPSWVAFSGYIVLAVISIITVSHIFPQLKWYHVLITYLIAPVLAFCNAYGCGLTDWSLASNYGKVAIIIFSSWVGLENGGIIAGLASCGVMMSIVSTASDLMQDFKTGYLTLASPRSMFASQVLGTFTGCLVSPLMFWFFHKAYTLGDPQGSYPAPYGEVYRGMALLGAKGFSSLPQHCLQLAIIFFFSAMLINIVHDLLLHYETRYKLHRFVPNPMALAIPFYLGGYFAIDMCIGSLILFLWEKRNKQKANDFGPVLASGLICGDSLWSVPAAILSLAGVNPPICMKFLSSAMNKRVDTFLNGV
ncbi:hypothetical protein ACSQ67_005451 [Phaseolus vulgaris]